MPTSRRRMASAFALLGLFPPVLAMALWLVLHVDSTRGPQHWRTIYLTARHLWLTAYMMMATEVTGSAVFWIVFGFSTAINMAIYALVGSALARSLQEWSRFSERPPKK